MIDGALENACGGSSEISKVLRINGARNTAEYRWVPLFLRFICANLPAC